MQNDTLRFQNFIVAVKTLEISQIYTDQTNFNWISYMTAGAGFAST